MRIIAGKLGGRQFNFSDNCRAHPMSEKARGGLFNALGDISGLTLLDAFAGSGAISFEAVSRGAKNVVAIEIDKKAHSSIQANIGQLFKGDPAFIKAIRANVSTWSDNNQDQQFDIVVCDPLYDDIKPELLQKLANHTKIGGVAVYSLPPKVSLELSPNSLPAGRQGYKLMASKSYGDATLVFYRKTK